MRPGSLGDPGLTDAELDPRRSVIGRAAHRLQRDAMENFIEMVQALGDTGEFRAAGVGPSPVNASSCCSAACVNSPRSRRGGRSHDDVTRKRWMRSIALLAPRSDPINRDGDRLRRQESRHPEPRPIRPALRDVLPIVYDTTDGVTRRHRRWGARSKRRLDVVLMQRHGACHPVLAALQRAFDVSTQV